MEIKKINAEEPSQLAEITGGLYFLAETPGPGALKNIYNTINKLEKVGIKSTRYTLYKEIFKYFVMVGFAVLSIQAILTFTFISKIP